VFCACFHDALAERGKAFLEHAGAHQARCFFHVLGALPQTGVYASHCGVVGLDQRKALARLDRLQLGAVSNHDQLFNPKPVGDREQVIHRLVRNQRRLVQHQDFAAQGSARCLELRTRTRKRGPQMLIHKG